MSRLKKVVSFVACILAATIVLGAFGYNKAVRAAEDTTKYVFEDAATSKSHIRTESGLEDYDELIYCLEILKDGPNIGVDYSRSLLSDTSYSDAVKSKLMVVLMDGQGIYDKIYELYDGGNGVKEAGWYWSNYGPNNYVYQHLIWIIVSENDFLEKRTDAYGYNGIELRLTGRDEYSYSKEDSVWNKVFVPLLNYIDSESSKYPVGKGAGQYDASFYTPNMNVQLLLGRGFVNPTPLGSLRITKTIEGDVSESDLTELKFTITDSNGKTYGPFTLGKDFTYDSDNDYYYMDLEDIDSSLTYTVEETDYSVDGTTVSITYQIGGTESGSGSVANDIALTEDKTTTVEFKDSYKEEVTTTTTSTSSSESSTTTTSSSEGDDSTTTTPATSGENTSTTPSTTSDGTTTATSGSDDTTTTASSAETGKDGSGVTTTGSSSETPATIVTGTSENSNSDSAKATPTAVPTKSTSGMTNSSAETTATPTPTGSASKTTSSTPDRSETTSTVTKTGESSSHTVAIAMVCIFAAGALLVIRSKKFKAE